MILLLAFLFLVATAIGSYFALGVAGQLLDGEREQPAPHQL
ncbi:MAG: hypothetical protein QOF55_2411 [Thermoleophilaceae bacterium]|jgi:hypothetical protein|nr:hypothetical protein [Thermoleophilaceae bacterium]